MSFFIFWQASLVFYSVYIYILFQFWDLYMTETQTELWQASL